MNATNNKRAVIVGIFILLGVGIFIAGILTLGGQKKTFEKKIEISAIFKDVGGLQAGNNVWFLGVKVGTVKKISFTPNSQVLVLMSIESSQKEFIKKDSKAKVGSEGFIGNKLVVISSGSAGSPVIQNEDMLTVESSLNTDEIMATFQENNKNLLAITGDMKDISRRLANGEGSVGKLLRDETLADNLQAASMGLRTTSANAQRFTANIYDYTSKLQSKGSLTNALVTDTVIFSTLRSTVSNLKQSSVAANEVTDNLKAATSDVKKVTANLNNGTSPIGVLLNDPAAAANLRGTLKNLNAGTKKLDENMEAIQHNFLL
ncbi:MAG: MlaD family protein, partial [Ferruginibacter sp.]